MAAGIDVFYPSVVTPEPGGGYRAVKWTVWYIDGHYQFRVIDLVPTLNPNTDMSSPNFRVAKFLGEYVGVRPFIAQYGLDPDDHILPPLKSMVAKDKIGQVTQHNRECFRLHYLGY